MVFYNHNIEMCENIPRYLDLGYYKAENGMPFTISSNLIYALTQAIESISKQSTFYSSINENSIAIRTIFDRCGLQIVNKSGRISPAVVTIQLPESVSSVEFGKNLEKYNCFISYKSGYLVERNWIQTFVTRNTTEQKVSVFAHLMKECFASIEMKEQQYIS